MVDDTSVVGSESSAGAGAPVALALAACDRFRRCSGISVNVGSEGVGRVGDVVGAGQRMHRLVPGHGEVSAVCGNCGTPDLAATNYLSDRWLKTLTW